MGLFARKTAGSALSLALFGAGILSPVAAHADPASKIYLPHVVYGEWEIELRGGFENWDGHDGDNAQQYVFDVGRGVTPWWFSEIAVFYSKAPGSGGEIEEIKSENIFQLTEPGRYWVDVGLIAEFVRVRAEHVNEVEIGPLFQKEVGHEQFNLNFEAERELEDGTRTELTYGFQWKHRGNPRAEFGIQAFGELGEFGDLGQEHALKIGPAIFGRADVAGNNKVKYDAAVLFGVTDSTPDLTVRFQLEYEIYGL